MKYTLLRGLSPDVLRVSVPSRFRSQLPDSLSEQLHTLILFRCDRTDVILSRVVEGALIEVDVSAERLVAVGGCFTAEGLAMLRSRGAIVLQLSDFYWTDESYQAVRKG